MKNGYSMSRQQRKKNDNGKGIRRGGLRLEDGEEAYHFAIGDEDRVVAEAEVELLQRRSAPAGHREAFRRQELGPHRVGIARRLENRRDGREPAGVGGTREGDDARDAPLGQPGEVGSVSSLRLVHRHWKNNSSKKRVRLKRHGVNAS